ncbi:MAG: ABC transporter substrate-binding protein [Chloroflexi bacterium]|nr:ABC transporter substrate-binding protein [Chloroflexota bacterium]
MLAGLALVVLLVAACDGDDEPAATATPLATATPAAATATPVPATPSPTATPAAPTPTPTPTPTATPAAIATPTATPTPTPTPTPTEAPTFPLTVEDSAGTEVTLEAPPERIISYSPGATELLFAIGAGDRVVATDEFSDFPPEAEELPKVAYSSPDPERALALEPDLLIMASRQREQIEQFRSLGMTVLFLDSAQNIEGVFETVALLGLVTGNEQQAADLVASMRGRIEAVTAALEEVEEGPLVFFELTADLYTVGTDTFVGELLTLAKARNIAEGAASSFPQLSAEAIIDAAPDVVLLADAAWGESYETVCARPGWDAIPACVNERVHGVDGDLTSRPGPRIVDGLEQIARLLYPDRFE